MSLGPPEPFVVRVEPPSGGSVVVAVSGELDLATVGELEAALEAQKRAHRHVLLDISGLTFLDSTGIRLLLWADADARRDGWAFSLRSEVHETVRRTLEMVGLLDYLQFERPG